MADQQPGAWGEVIPGLIQPDDERHPIRPAFTK